MKYGIDIDDTIIHETDVFLSCAKEFCNMKGIPFNLNIRAKHTNDLFGWSKTQELEFWALHGTKTISLPPREDAIKFINNKIIDNEIHFISARTIILQEYTEYYFSKYKIPYTKLCTGIKDKKKYCSENGIDLFIDDNVINCESVSTLNIPVYLMLTELNNAIILENKSIQRISSFAEII